MKLKQSILLLVAVLAWFHGLGQAVPADFSLNNTNGRYCVGDKVEITNLIAPPPGSTVSKVAQYFFNFDNDKSDFIIPSDGNALITHIYTLPGTYKLVQQGGRQIDGTTVDLKSQTIIVMPLVSPKFSVGLCEGGVTKFTFTDGVYTTYLINNGVDPEFAVPSIPQYMKTYTDFTAKTVTVRGECPATATMTTFTPLNTLTAPDVLSQTADTYTGNKDSTAILINTVGTMRYKILQYLMGNWESIDTISGLSGLKTLPKYATGIGDAYFAVSSFDACGKELQSPTLAIPKLIGQALNNQNELNWGSILPEFLPEVASILVYRNDALYATLPSTANSFIDNKVVCGRKYNYNLKVISIKNNVFNNKPVESNSAPIQLIAKSSNKPSALTNLNSTIEGNAIKLTWDKPNSTISYYTIYRAQQGQPFQQLQFSFNDSFTDTKVEANSIRYCYKLTLTDSCGNTSDDSLITCPILLQSQKNNNDQHLSDWWKYENGNTVMPTYTVEVYDNTNKIINSFNVSTDTNFVYNDVALDVPYYRYRVKASLNGVVFYYSNFTEVRNEILIFIPDAFTPNGDGVNDDFKVFGKYFKDFKLSIFNRWGDLVYYSENRNEGWKGDYQGQPSIPGVYAYVFSATDNSNKPYTKKGTVILIK